MRTIKEGGVVPTTSRWWSKEGAWQGGGVDKGGAAAVYKMLIASTTLLAAKPLQKNPHFEKNGPTKLPSQMGHKGSGAVYRTFRPPLPRLPACLLAPIVCLGKGSWGVEE